MKRPYLLIFLCLSLSNFSVDAQIKKVGTPISSRLGSANTSKILKKEVTIIDMPQLDKKRLDEIKANNEIDGTLFQFAYGFKVNINVQKESIKDSLENGILYRLKIRSTSAKSINVIFGNYKLPESADLFLYGNNADLSDGAFTNRNNKKNKQLATEPINGDVITVEYFEPYDVEFSEHLIINKI